MVRSTQSGDPVRGSVGQCPRAGLRSPGSEADRKVCDPGPGAAQQDQTLCFRSEPDGRAVRKNVSAQTANGQG